MQTQPLPWETKQADSRGVATFDWGGRIFGDGMVVPISSQGNNARMFKVEKDGRVGGAWITAFDLQAYKVMGGGVEGDFHYHGSLKIELN